MSGGLSRTFQLEVGGPCGAQHARPLVREQARAPQALGGLQLGLDCKQLGRRQFLAPRPALMTDAHSAICILSTLSLRIMRPNARADTDGHGERTAQ